MNDHRTRADAILDSFVKFHRENPDVWEMFKRFCGEVIASGKTSYSSNAIFERIRWHTEIETTGIQVKLSNNFRAYYARLYHIAFPEHDGFFRNRKLTSKDQLDHGLEVQEFNFDQPEEEEAIMERLAELIIAEQNEIES